MDLSRFIRWMAYAAIDVSLVLVACDAGAKQEVTSMHLGVAGTLVALFLTNMSRTVERK